MNTVRRTVPALFTLCVLAAVSTRADTRYVWQDSPNPGPPHADWSTAAHTIQDALDAAGPGDEVVVTNGVYATGGRALVGTMTNRAVVTRALTLRSVNGPEFTIIQGYQVPGTTNGIGAIRCVWLTNGAVLSGFTLTNGATQITPTPGPPQARLAGGGVWCASTNTLITNCTLIGNSARSYGGGAFQGTLNNCTLAGNSAGSGGGAYSNTLNNCTLAGNTAGSGGGAYLGTLNDCTLTGNSASSSGGGAYSNTLNNCTLTTNSAGSYGGGAYGGMLNNCTLTGNSATATLDSGGGAVYKGTLNNCTLTGNSAGTYGGGAYETTLDNCTLAANSASTGGGAYRGTLKNCTLTGNSASSYSGGAYMSTMYNCVIYYNTAPNSPNYHPGNLSFCCTTPLPASGTGNITADPQLASTSHLSISSPCRAAGNAAYATGTDIDGEPWASPPSIGCDEYGGGALTGDLTVAVQATSTIVAPGYAVDLSGWITGQVGASVWDFGDGTVLSNRPCASHTWSAAGDYPVVLRAYNASHPEGVRATLTIRVVVYLAHYVSADSVNPVPPYSSWETAARTIQEAVDAAVPEASTILVSNGVYATGGRAVYGTMTNRVAVCKPITLTSVNGPEVTIIQGYQLPGATNGDGAMRCVYLTNGASLSGFTLTKGATLGTGESVQVNGGGLWCESTNARVTNCTLTGNSANYRGGGAHQGTLYHCTLARNSAQIGSGAVSNILNNCTLAENSASFAGGGANHATLNNCALIGNSGGVYGGGAYYCALLNCKLSGNSATNGGGAYQALLNNCTFTGNSANTGGGAVYATMNNSTLAGNSAGSVGGASLSVLNNCILYYNTATDSPNYTSSTLSYSCATPLFIGGTGNIDVEPLFVDRLNGDLRLQSNSPCINLGDNAYVDGATDVDGNPRIVNGTVDIGACEWQVPSRFAPVAPPGSGGLELTLFGEPGRAYDLHATSNLMSWLWLARVTNTAGQATYTDPLSPCPPVRFYKAMPVP